jgi:hypothetical protein
LSVRDAVLPTIRAAESQAYRDAGGSSEAEMARAQWKAAGRGLFNCGQSRRFGIDNDPI